MMLEVVSALLIGFGLLSLMLCVLNGVVELARLRKVSGPPPRTFSQMVTQSTHWQTIALPAMGALLAGWLVSLSASFFFVAFTTNPGGWQGAVGCALLAAAFVLLVVVLDLALRRVGDAADLLRDPWAIRAAAEESARDVPGSIDPDDLRQALDRWTAVKSARSLAVTRDVQSPFLDAVFAASRAGKSRPKVPWRRACVIYFAAATRLPWAFAWPIAGPLAVEVGLGIAVAGIGLKPWQMALTLLVLLLVLLLPVLFHAIAVGLRALRVDALYDSALKEAADEIARAEARWAGFGRDGNREDRILLRIGAVVISLARKTP